MKDYKTIISTQNKLIKIREFKKIEKQKFNYLINP